MCVEISYVSVEIKVTHDKVVNYGLKNMMKYIWKCIGSEILIWITVWFYYVKLWQERFR